MTILPRLKENTGQDDVEEYPFLVECHKDKNCFFRVTAETYARAKELDATHPCPSGADITYGASMTQSILQKAWAELDELTAKLKSSEKTDPQYEYYKGRAMGVATVLALFMPPHFTTTEEISREALKRWQAATADPPVEHETPGLGALRYTFPSDQKYKTAEARAAEAKQRQVKGTETVDEETRTAIKRVYGVFEAHQVADLYKLSIKTVERIWAE